MTAAVPGMSDIPEPIAFDITIKLRESLDTLVAADPDSYVGADLSRRPFSDYAYDKVTGTQLLGPAALKQVADEFAEAMFIAFNRQWPHPSILKPDPNAYWFIGQLWPDPELATSAPVNPTTMRFMEVFFDLMKQYGYTFVESVAYEILNFFMPDDWKQRDYLGNPALSGWSPPSCFIRPTSGAALRYLARVQIQVLEAAIARGVPAKFQIGEPWWWDGSYSNGAPCIYDPQTRLQYKQETGNDVPTPWIETIYGPLAPEQVPYAEWLREKLGQSTNYIRDLVKAHFAPKQVDATLLFFTPQIMSPASELTGIMNFPTEYWKAPNYDFVQIEDYDWVIDGRLDLVPLTFDAATERLGYPRSKVHYFAGFILNAFDYHIWPWIDKAIRLAKDAEMPYIYIWSYTQAMRDSIVYGDSLPSALKVPIFDVPPNWAAPYNVTREYNTEVQTSTGLKEMRRAGRQVARKSLSFTALFDNRDRRRFDSFLATWQGFRFYVPDYSRRTTTTTELLPTAIAVTLETIPDWMQLGTVVILTSPDMPPDARVVDRILPETNTIEFLAQSADARIWPAGTTILPGLYGQLADSISSNRLSGNVTENLIQFNVVPGSEPAMRNVPPASLFFDGVEVFDKEPNWVSAPNITFGANTEVVDYGTGAADSANFHNFMQRMTKMSFQNRTVEEMNQFHAFLERTKGQQGTFWCPSWEYDLDISPETVPGNTLIVEGDDIALYLKNDSVMRNIAMVDYEGRPWCFRITSVAAVPGKDQTRITVTPDVTRAMLDNVEKVSWLTLCRQASDAITESWTNEGVANFDMTVRSLQTTEK